MQECMQTDKSTDRQKDGPTDGQTDNRQVFPMCQPTYEGGTKILLLHL